MPYDKKPKKSVAKKVSKPTTKKVGGVWYHKMPNGKWMKGKSH